MDENTPRPLSPTDRSDMTLHRPNIIIRPFRPEEGGHFFCTAGECQDDATRFVGLSDTAALPEGGWVGHAACDDPDHRHEVVGDADRHYNWDRFPPQDWHDWHNEDRSKRYGEAGCA